MNESKIDDAINFCCQFKILNSTVESLRFHPLEVVDLLPISSSSSKTGISGFRSRENNWTNPQPYQLVQPVINKKKKRGKRESKAIVERVDGIKFEQAKQFLVVGQIFMREFMDDNNAQKYVCIDILRLTNGKFNIIASKIESVNCLPDRVPQYEIVCHPLQQQQPAINVTSTFIHVSLKTFAVFRESVFSLVCSTFPARNLILNNAST